MTTPPPDPQPNEDTEMRPEYDFRGVVGGKYHRKLDKGYTVEIQQPDGTAVVEQHKLDEELTLAEEIDVWEATSDEDALKLEELLNQPEEAFQKSLRHVLEKNEELYRRLA